MVKLALASDVHLEFSGLALKNTENADVLILAGDICVARDFELADKNLFTEKGRANRYLEFFEQASKEFSQVCYVMGNHEHYSGDFKYTYGILKRALQHLPNVHLLEKETFDIGDITIIGATLWTDMNDNDPTTLQAMPKMMNDFFGVDNSNIMVSRQVPLYDNENFETNKEGYVVRNVIGHKIKETPSKFKPEHAVEDHNKALDYINHVVSGQDDKKFVVVTHHCPSHKSIHPQFKHATIMNGGFTSQLDDFIAYRPQIKYWLFGHTHWRHEYTIGETVVCNNARGYVGHEEMANSFTLKYIDV